jgi:hypothetical protein
MVINVQNYRRKQVSFEASGVFWILSFVLDICSQLGGIAGREMTGAELPRSRRTTVRFTPHFSFDHISIGQSTRILLDRSNTAQS